NPRGSAVALPAPAPQPAEPPAVAQQPARPPGANAAPASPEGRHQDQPGRSTASVNVAPPTNQPQIQIARIPSPVPPRPPAAGPHLPPAQPPTLPQLTPAEIVERGQPPKFVAMVDPLPDQRITTPDGKPVDTRQPIPDQLAFAGNARDGSGT